MKRTLGIIFMVMLLPVLSNAQNGSGLRISTGIALGKYGKFDHHFGYSDETNFPSFIIQAERDWIDNFSIGAYVGYSGQKHEFVSHQPGLLKYNYYRVGAVLSYNLNQWLGSLDLNPGRDWDLYTSLKAGFSLENIKDKEYLLDIQDRPYTISDSDSNLLLDLGVSLGARYYLSNDFAIFSELGWGNAGFLTVGASFTL